MRRSNATTLQDIAQEAGVTAMAASVVLNGSTSSTRVSAATRERILDAASRLRYRPNAVARGLSRRRMDTIGLVAVIDGGDLNHYFLELLNGVLAESAEQGQNTTIFSISNWEEESRIFGSLDGRVDGIVLLAPQMLSASFAAMLHDHTSYVAIHGNDLPPLAHNIEVDNEGGAYLMTKHMIDLGHREIAHFTGMRYLRGAEQRLQGYRCALKEAGIPLDDRLVFDGWYSKESGRERTQQLLSCHGESLPTAIFCANDAIAMGCMEVLQENGISIPQDISIGGFDGLFSSSVTRPQLTTVRQPFRQLGHRAVEYLIGQIRLDSTTGVSRGSAGGEEIFPVELIVRGSVGPVPNRRIRFRGELRPVQVGRASTD